MAQHPARVRDESRLMLVSADGGDGDGGERRFSDLPLCLRAGDLLVRNNVKVFPARLVGRRAGGGGGAAELLLVRKEGEGDDERWLCLARPANRFKEDRAFHFGTDDTPLTAKADGRGGDGMVRVSFSLRGDAFLAALDRVGRVPLPPYIERSGPPSPEDAERYQTVYAKRPGAVAAPTAGLHFTEAVDRALAARGIGVCEITLNVGPGTFRPVKEELLDNHRMHAEWYSVPETTRSRVRETKQAGGRVVAVGTTTVRALEAAASTGVSEGWTDLFIRPGYAFRTVDGMVTNFHLPGSSLLVMLSAFAGRERILACYEKAVRGAYRFYSYGDAMLVWRRE